jgi:epoxyqueuosine reductase
MALDEGFDLVRFGPVAVGEDGQRFAEWIAAGRHGEMHYLERNQDRIIDPQRWLPAARTTMAVAIDYGGPQPAFGSGRVARYAAGRDYHRVLGQRLERLGKRLQIDGIGRDAYRVGVDAVPVLERALAARAGIGFLAKTSGVIHPDRGPWLLLGEMLLAQELEPDGPSIGSCGTCSACLEACPTGALVAPFQLDARLCLSYTTIELRGPIPEPLRAAHGDWLFGCDVCIEVCPFAHRGRSGGAGGPRPADLRHHPVFEQFDLVGILELSLEDYEQWFRGTAMRRARREGLRRNAAIVLGNLGDGAAVAPLTTALEDSDPVLRGHAAWALGRVGGRSELLRALQREREVAVVAEIRAALDGC